MKRIVIALVAIVVLAAGGAVIWFFRAGDVGPATEVTAPPVSAVAGAETLALGDGTTASFTIHEELRGSPKTVVATTSDVVGEITLDRTDLAQSAIGKILVSARTFTTDSGNRDRAIRGPILDSSAVEFIEFTPTSIDGLEGSATVGTPMSFTVSGDLEIRDQVAPVTFSVTATLADDGSVSGTATADVTRTAFGLQIPSVPGVANVSDDVSLELKFVARP